MVENRKNITKLKIKHRNGAIARPSVHTFLLQKGGENIFYRSSTQIPGVPGTLWTHPSYLSCFFSHVINKPESFRKRHSSLFTLHIPAVIIINRTIPNINTNSQIYYKERKEDLEIFLYGSPVNRYIDYHVLSFSLGRMGPVIVFYQLWGIMPK